MLIMEDVSMTVNNEGENREIVHHINLEFEPGRLYAVTGPNGGGKTSIAKIIMGIYRHNQGRLIFRGEDISSLSVSERAQKGIAYAFQQPPRFKGLNVTDLLMIAQPGLDAFLLRKYLRDVGLCPEDYLERDVGPSLSGGEMKRIEIAQVLARNAHLSIFDEPEAGVDLWTVQKLLNIIISRYKNNTEATAIIITHNQNVLPVCDQVIVIEDGSVKARGTPVEIWPLIKDDIECKMREQCDQCQGGVTYAI